jgi:23S rRNA pseudouridine1911/1915/1917 synthase
MLEGLLFRVPEELDGCRLDRFIRRSIPSAPARSIRFALDAGDDIVGSEAARKGRILRSGQEIKVIRIYESRDWLPVPGDVPGASLLFADGDVAVLSKPTDVHTEPHRPQEQGTLAGYLRWLFPGVSSVTTEPGLTLLTRLDYATSGAVPAALTSHAYEFLLREREQGRIVKTYTCIVSGTLEKAISLDFRLDTNGGEKVTALTSQREPDPRYWTAVTPIRTTGEYTLVKAVISKGKRHQIRAHLAGAGFPIVGDRRYSAVPPEGPGTARLMLHASEIRFAHPGEKGLVSVTSPLPAEFDSFQV